MTKPALLEVRNVSKDFTVGTRFSARGKQIVHAVDGVSLAIMPGETLGHGG